MSSSIIYHSVGMLLPPALTGFSQDLFLIAAQIGESNCYEYAPGGGNGRRSRSWEALHFGTEHDVIADAIRLAGGFEGGTLKLDRYRGGDVRPETYISRARRILASARDHDLSRGSIRFKDGHVYAVPEIRKPRGNGGFDRKTIGWDNRDVVREFIAATVGDPARGRAYNFFRVSGPELRR
jgi:hypothetical protein